MATVILLHGSGGNLDELGPLAQYLPAGLELLAVEAPRRIHDPDWRTPTYQWFDIQEPGTPEPVTFGDSLFQLEQLVYEVSKAHQRKSKSLYLLGHEQGALLGLAISLVLPDYLSGVVAICGCLPQIAAWPLPHIDLDGLPYLLIYDRGDIELPKDLVLATAKAIRERGGAPKLRAVTGARNLNPSVSKAVREWLRLRAQ